VNKAYNRILNLVVQLEEGYSTGGPGTGERVGKFIKKAGSSPGGFTKKQQDQSKRIFRKVVTKKTKSTGGKTPSADTQRRRADTFRVGVNLGATGKFPGSQLIKDKNTDKR